MPGPRVDIRDHQEGWVDVRFTVKADGSIADAVVAGTHAAAGERLTAALSVASRCRFTPGTLKGAPADTLNQTQRVFFQMDPPDKATDYELVKRFKDVRDYLEKGAFEKAADTLDRIEGQSSNLYEISQVLSRRAALAVRQGQPVLALMYLRQVEPNADYMTAEERQALQRLRLQLELDLGLPVDAARTAALIADLGRQNGDKPLQDRLAALEKTVAGNAAFGVQGRLPQQCPADLCTGGRVEWVYHPSNRTISLANIQGNLDKVTARCQGKTYEARAEAGVSWTIPASWGDCAVAVSGQPGSSFQLVDEKLPPA
ncbi:hypothetical protein GE253_18345 [Niveispirillum sp. SYP-B3756]|uniref:energy transducer TonB n=1 Tax=Niveispirillum sp. SYP-B3756 TaxID=2662178 RepID=UPI001292868A|nr:hypothetical protein [Niveispirillum sp. SYP-B3756]MQP67290.1 hypothetical protein [Niveispirillum sp. SYP-B3756]